MPGGLIPARAGTTSPSCSVQKIERAHPRSRGDHSPSEAVAVGGAGSSPLARGPHRSGGYRPRPGGLIPARAGTTPDSSLVDSIARAHPRSRGDHGLPVRAGPGQAGSSPLARGPHSVEFGGPGIGGLIPARAGTTRTGARTGPGAGAHPRSRGDHSLSRLRLRLLSGSSPLARGPPHPQVQENPGRGLIPARAGTTRFLG